MNDLELREIHGEEFKETIYELAAYSFHPSPPLTNRHDFDRWINTLLDSTCLALFEGKRPLVCIQSTSMTQNVRGELFPMAAFWGLSTTPEVRRKGYARRVFIALMEATQKQGHAFSTLYPFRESYYERLGYATFPSTRLARLTPDALAPVLKYDLPGEVRLVRIEKGLEDYRRFMKRKLSRTHGMAYCDKTETIREKMRDLWIAEARRHGQMEGIMVYGIEGGDDDQGKFQFTVSRLDYETSEAKYLLLRWIALHIDQADRAVILIPPSERPETWLADTKLKTELYDTPMGRVLDISRINGMRVGPETFSVVIRDPACPWNEGGWRFEAVDGKLRVSRDPKAKDGLTIMGLTGLVYGTHDPADFASRGWGELSPKSVEAARVLFPRAEPYLDENF
jgi:predicted acetyltransferase